MSCASSAGACDRHETAQSIIAVTDSSIAARISWGETTMTSGRPLAICLPRTSARSSSSIGAAEPMVNLICSAVRSPIATPYSALMKFWIAVSISNEPTRTASRATTPPIEISAVSVVPPPTSTMRFPMGSLIGRPDPIAAASGCSMSRASAAPALRAASVTALRSTAVIADGTQITTLGLLKRETPTRSSKRRIIRCVTSKSVIAPWRNGRTATM